MTWMTPTYTGIYLGVRTWATLGLLRAVYAGLLCFAATVVTAQQLPPLVLDEEALVEDEDLRRYSVEVIVFSYADSVSAGTEIFIPDPVADPLDAAELEETAAPVDALDLVLMADGQTQTAIETVLETNDDAIPAYGDLLPEYEFEGVELVELISADSIDLQVLMRNELTMTAIHEKLILLDAYQPVLWAGWTQVILSQEDTPAIRLRRLGSIPLTFEGTLKLYLSRFLHLVVDIAMDEESAVHEDPPVAEFKSRFGRRDRDQYEYPFTTLAPTPVLQYQIVENQIMKSEDIRYFDHPKFGVIAKVTRYEALEESDEFEDGEFEDGKELQEESDSLDPGTSLSRSN